MSHLNSPVENGLKSLRVPISEIKKDFSIHRDERITVLVESTSNKADDKVALLRFEFRNEVGQVFPMNDWHSRSKVVGDFSYLSAAEDPDIAHDQFELVRPEGATILTVEGVQWKKDAQTVVFSDVEIHAPKSGYKAQSFPSGHHISLPSSQISEVVPIDEFSNFVKIKIDYVSPEAATNAAPVQVIFKDANGDYLAPFSELPQSPKLGSFISLPLSKDRTNSIEVNISIPMRSRTLELVGVEWGKNDAMIQGPIEFYYEDGQNFDLELFIRNLDPDTPLIVIDTTAPPLGHETLALRPNNLSAAYSRMGITTIFLPFGSLQEFPAKIDDNLVQVGREQVNRLIELLSAHRAAENSYFICSSFPSIQSITTVQRLKRLGWTTLYEARDDMEEFNRVGYSKWYDPQLERQMLNLVDTTVSVSSALDGKLQTIVPKLENHHIVPNGVNTKVIADGAHLRTMQAAKNRNEKCVVGYVGHLTSSWFDWPLLLEAASRQPETRFEIVGHGMPEGLALPPNVEYLGPKTHEELPPIVANWKIGLIPFADLPLTRSVDPNKIYEYFAWGLRCVSAPMGMVDQYPSTWVYRGLESFCNCINEAMSSDIDAKELSVLESFLETASWDNRAKTMAQLLGLSA